MTAQRAALIDEISRFPGINQVLAKGDNKISFKLRTGLQVDVRTLSPNSYGAGLQYFTGSKSHGVALRQRALKMGLTLNEYGLSRLDDNDCVAGKTEEDIYQRAQARLDSARSCARTPARSKPPKSTQLPNLITIEDLRGEVHMHTVETDGRNTIDEMAEAAMQRGYKYIAITDHSKNLAMANGLDDERALQHIARIKDANQRINGITIMTGIEVDILADGCARPLRFRARADGRRRRQRSFSLQPGKGADDGPPAARYQQQERVNPRTSHRPSSVAPRRPINSISKLCSKRQRKIGSRWS